MARMPRLVVPGVPHHVTQRGARRMRTFFLPEDYQTYLDLMIEGTADHGVSVWAYCLMPNHVHLILVPQTKDAFSDLFRFVHRQYTRRINFRENWRGHLWQERFHSFPMDERHLLSAVRYVELNPVRAGLCATPEAWRWSSVRAHLRHWDDRLVELQPMLERVDEWARYLTAGDDEHSLETIRRHAGTGRPLGDDRFIERLEAITGRALRKRKPGPKPKIR